MSECIIVKFLFSRAFKSSTKELLVTPAWETLSTYWKSEIMTEIHPIYKEDPKQLCGALLDPKEFIPKYLYRFLLRQEKEGNKVPPGSYAIEFKVCHIKPHLDQMLYYWP